MSVILVCHYEVTIEALYNVLLYKLNLVNLNLNNAKIDLVETVCYVEYFPLVGCSLGNSSPIVTMLKDLARD